MTRPKLDKKCTVPGCSRRHEAKGLCPTHYARLKRHGSIDGGRTTQEDIRRAIESAVVYSGDECIIWPFCRDTNGYGRARVNGRVTGAHRVVCIAVNGNPPTPEHEAAHSCGKGHLGCITPRHLRWATHKENNWDRREHGTDNRGERHGISKLKQSDVVAIKAELADRKRLLKEIGAQYGVSEATIRNIAKGQSWGWLTNG